MFDDIDRKVGTITITKRGKPIATVGPVRKRPQRSSEGILKGKLHISDELLEELLNVGLSDPNDGVREKEKSAL